MPSQPYVWRLNGVHPKLVAECHTLMATMKALGFPLFIANGLRTIEEQRALYEQGRTKPGKIVTFADGSDLTKATHCPQSDGWGHAVDFAFLAENPWDTKWPWRAFGECAKALDLKWGGDFKSLKGDLGHVEL